MSLSGKNRLAWFGEFTRTHSPLTQPPMKPPIWLLLLVALSLSRCQYWKLPEPKPIVNYEQDRLNLLRELRPQLTGTWLMKSFTVDARKNRWNGDHLRLDRDTTFLNLASLTIAPVGAITDSQRDKYAGTIAYKNKVYPIWFDLWPSLWLYGDRKEKGPKAVVLVAYDFPAGYTYVSEPERKFLEEAGFIHDNFFVETATDQLSMVWQGLNRGITRIEMVRQ